MHRIKDDDMDYQIARPYQKTRELSGQIQNLKAVPSGSGISEKRISKSIQRDSWSAIKYGLRLAQRLERALAISAARKKSDGDEELEKFRGKSATATAAPHGTGRMVTTRRGGRLY